MNHLKITALRRSLLPLLQLTLKKKAVGSSETFLSYYQTAVHHVSQDRDIIKYTLQSTYLFHIRKSAYKHCSKMLIISFQTSYNLTETTVYLNLLTGVSLRNVVTTTTFPCIQIQVVPLATEPGISLIILTPMKILQRNLNRTTFVV
jgi:hypothetical protein